MKKYRKNLILALVCFMIVIVLNFFLPRLLPGNPIAYLTGFSEEDAQILQQCLLTLFENDASSARPDGSMAVHRLYWWRHNGKTGQYPTAKVHGSVRVTPKDRTKLAQSVEDYDITLDELPGLTPEVFDGV